jgi:hypothetical protein
MSYSGKNEEQILPALEAAEDYFLDALINEAVNNDEGKIEEDEAAALPDLTSIWQCPMLNKTIAVDDDGTSYAGWTSGWCPCRSDGSKAKPFWPAYATKALMHVAKIAGFDIWPCQGYIPPEKSMQYRALYCAKAVAKDLRQSKKESMTTKIENMQDRAVVSLANASTSSGWESLLVCSVIYYHFNYLFVFLCHVAHLFYFSLPYCSPLFPRIDL